MALCDLNKAANTGYSLKDSHNPLHISQHLPRAPVSSEPQIETIDGFIVVYESVRKEASTYADLLLGMERAGLLQVTGKFPAAIELRAEVKRGLDIEISEGVLERDTLSRLYIKGHISKATYDIATDYKYLKERKDNPHKFWRDEVYLCLAGGVFIMLVVLMAAKGI